MSKRKDSWITGRLERSDGTYKIVEPDGTTTELSALLKGATAEGILTHIHFRTYYKHDVPADANQPNFLPVEQEATPQ